MTALCYGEIDLDIYLALDRLPTLDAAATVKDEFENVGGAAANSALWLAHWGVATRLAGLPVGTEDTLTLPGGADPCATCPPAAAACRCRSPMQC